MPASSDVTTPQRRSLQPLWNDLDGIVAQAPNDWLLAVSGGGDSRALMESVAMWPRRPSRVRVITVDHATRPEAAKDAQHVRLRAEELDLPCTVVTLEAHRRPPNEAQLRQQRRHAFITHSQPGEAIVLGHHETDVATGLLMALAGEGGSVAAMPAAVYAEQRWWLRPFIARPQQQLLAALVALHIHDVVHDPGDARGDNARSRWQQHALVTDRASALARHAREVRELTDVIDAMLPATQLPLPAPPAVVRRFVRAELKRLSAPGADLRSSNRTIDDVLQWRGGPARYDLGGGVQAWVERGPTGYQLSLRAHPDQGSA
jgi:hypothetical protein